MSTLLAVSRPTEWNFPLFIHVLGAMILVGGLLTGASTIAFARGDARFLRLGYWTLLAVALPGWIVMFAPGANWISARKAGMTCLRKPPADLDRNRLDGRSCPAHCCC